MDDEEYCSHCNGSGEGQYDGTRCGYCKGSGFEPKSDSNDDFDEPD